MLPKEWSSEDEKQFRLLYPHTANAKLSQLFGLAVQTIGQMGSERGLKKSPGGTGRAVPLGTERTTGRGYRVIKTAEGGGGKAWTFLQVVVWREHFGDIPKGFRVSFKDGNRCNCSPDNLVLVTRRQMMSRNTIHNYPPEVRDAIRTLAKLNRLIDEKQNH